MDFTLSKEHEMARALFREFAEKEVKPLAIEVDETEVFPRETVEKMAKAGFMGIPVILFLHSVQKIRRRSIYQTLQAARRSVLSV